MTRDGELQAQATRVQRGGPITDYFGCGPTVRERYGEGYEGGSERLALCRCIHGKEWPEGDAGEAFGGAACFECVTGGAVRA